MTHIKIDHTKLTWGLISNSFASIHTECHESLWQAIISAQICTTKASINERLAET